MPNKQRGRPPKLSPADTQEIVNNPNKLKAKDLAALHCVSPAYIYQVRARFKKGAPVVQEQCVQEPVISV